MLRTISRTLLALFRFQEKVLRLTSCLGGTVGSGGSGAVGTVRGHAGGHDDGALDAKLYELAGDDLGAEVGTVDVQVEEFVELSTVELQSRLVLGHAGVGNETVNAARLLHDLVDGVLDALFGGHIGLDVLEVGVALLQSGEVFAGLHHVEREDELGLVGKADLCDSQTNAPIGTGDGDDLLAQRDLPAEVFSRHGAQVGSRGLGLAGIGRSVLGGSRRHGGIGK